MPSGVRRASSPGVHGQGDAVVGVEGSIGGTPLNARLQISELYFYCLGEEGGVGESLSRRRPRDAGRPAGDVSDDLLESSAWFGMWQYPANPEGPSTLSRGQAFPRGAPVASAPRPA